MLGARNKFKIDPIVNAQCDFDVQKGFQAAEYNYVWSSCKPKTLQAWVISCDLRCIDNLHAY